MEKVAEPRVKEICNHLRPAFNSTMPTLAVNIFLQMCTLKYVPAVKEVSLCLMLSKILQDWNVTAMLILGVCK